jgi:hypothetical protein
LHHRSRIREQLVPRVFLQSRPANRRPIGGVVIAALSLASGFLWLGTLQAQQALGDPEASWIEAGKGRRLAAEMTFANPDGRLGVLLSRGAIDTQAIRFSRRSGPTAGRASPVISPRMR